MGFALSIASWLTGSKIGRYVLIGLFITAIIGYVLFSVYRKGQKAERLKQKARELESMKKAVESDAKIDSMSRSERREYLSKWVRDE